MKLREKISVFVLFTGLLGMLVSYAIAHSSASKLSQKYYEDTLHAVREAKSTQIKTYFKRMRDETSMLSQNMLTVEATKDFIQAFKKVKDFMPESDAEVSERTINQLKRITTAGDNKSAIELVMYQMSAEERFAEKIAAFNKYSKTYFKYNPSLSLTSDKFNYHNILIVDAETGDLVYSVKQEYEFGRSLLNHTEEVCNLCKAFLSAKNAYYKDFVRLIDFDFYSSTSKIPASFVSAPIYDGDKLIATIIVHLSVDEIINIMNGSENWEGEGLGKSGETFIVGADFKMRSHSRFFTEDKESFFESLREAGASLSTIETIRQNDTTVLYQKVETDAVRDALLGKSGEQYNIDYRGMKVLSSYSPLDIPDVNWAVISEINYDEVIAPVKALQRNTFIQICGFSSLLLLLSAFFSRKITGPLSNLTVALEQLGEGNFNQKLAVKSDDEIGVLTRYFNHTSAELESMTKSVDAFRSKSDNLEKEIEEVVKLSQYDFLTGAYNRNMISMEINQLLSDRRNLNKANSVLMFDLDNFKYINDTFGHDKGDEILKIIADLVQDRKRDQDIFARWGGDEFMMLLPSTNLRQANFFAEKIRQRIEAHPVLRRNNITCSFGVTQLATQKSEEEIFKQVDIALYEAKNHGRNCVKSFKEEATFAAKISRAQ